MLPLDGDRITASRYSGINVQVYHHLSGIGSPQTKYLTKEGRIKLTSTLPELSEGLLSLAPETVIWDKLLEDPMEGSREIVPLAFAKHGVCGKSMVALILAAFSTHAFSNTTNGSNSSQTTKIGLEFCDMSYVRVGVSAESHTGTTVLDVGCGLCDAPGHSQLYAAGRFTTGRADLWSCDREPA